MSRTLEQVGIVVAAVALDVALAGTGTIGLAAYLGATGAAIVGSLAAAGVTALGALLLTPAQKRTLSLRDPIASHKLIYGQMKVGGAITFIDTTSDNATLFIVLTLTGHPVRSIDGIYINDTYVPLNSSGNALVPPVWPDGTKPTSYKDHCTVLKGNGTVAGDAAMIAALAAASSKWGANFFQYNRGKIYVRLGWNQNLFGSTGVPNISAVVRGRMVYDPREPHVVMTTSTSGSPGVFNTSGAHSLAVGDMVFIRGHSGSVPSASTTAWPAAQRNGVAQEYEVGTVPTSTSFTLLGPDSQPLAISSGGSGGSVTKMIWSDNSQLAINDYLVEPYHGMGVIFDTEVDQGLLTTNANICDEIVPRVLPISTFTADSSTDEITWAENQTAGALPPLCQLTVSTTGVLPGGLAADTVYYYAQTGAGPIGKLCDTAAHAAHVPPIGVNITSAGSGIQTLTVVESLSPDHTTSSFNVYDNALRITTGTEVQLSNFGGSVPSGLSAGTDYYAIFLSDTVIQLASSLENARIGTPVSFSDNGSGTTFVQVEAEPRYTCNGVVDSAEPRQSVIQKMLTSMGGYLVPSGTLLNVYPAAYITPTVTLDESDLRGAISVTSLQSGQVSFNSVKGTFVDPFNKGQPTDYPQYQDSAFIADDQYEVIWKDLSLEFTNSSSMAQRLAKIDLRRIRQELTVQMPLKLTAFQVGSPDVIMVDNAKWGWSGETFEVSTWAFSITGDRSSGQTLNCDIIGRKLDSSVFAWTAAEEAAAKRQTNTNLPNPFVVAAPTSLTLQSGGSLLVQQADGTIVSRIEVSWASPVDQFVLNGGFIEIVYAIHNSGNWQSAATVPGDQTFGFIENAAIGQSYDIAIRARNAIGGVSDTTHPWQAETDGYVVQGKTNAPSDVASITVGINGMTVNLSGSPVTDTDVVVYEYRYGASATWAAMTLIEQVAAVPNGSGGVAGTCTSGNLPAGTWRFAVKAINRSGIYSVNAAVSSPIVFAKQIDGGTDIVNNSITAAQFAANIQPVAIVSSLPVSGSYVGQIVVLTTDQRLYRWTGSAWTLEVPAVAVSGQLTDSQIAALAAAKLTGQITTTQITNNAITTPKIAAGSVTTNEIAASTIVAGNIAASTITSTQIAAATIQGNNIAANTLTSGLIAANAIVAGAIAAGAINASAIIVNNIIVTGHIQAGQVTSFSQLTSVVASITTVELNAFGSNATVAVTVDSSTKVLVQFAGSFTRAGGTTPTVTVNLYRVNGLSQVLLASSIIGGSGISENAPFIVSAVDTTPTAGASNGHYFATAFLTGTASPAVYNNAVLWAMAGQR